MCKLIIQMSAQSVNISHAETQAAQDQQPLRLSQPQSMTVKGALIGAVITAFISWNTGRYSRIGTFLKRWRFVRTYIMEKQRPFSFPITNYHHPLLEVVANNFYCYSGEPGIGKSYHFQLMVAQQSLKRPSIYVSFKTIGRENNFQHDISQQLNYGEDQTNMLSQIIRAIKKIHQINRHPRKFQLRCFMLNLSLAGMHLLLWKSGLAEVAKLIISSAGVFAQLYLMHFMGPLLRQSVRRSAPMVVFDDLNKIEQLNMLAEIVRFLQLVQADAANVILVSSDEETWARLRREPGMKDRLRVRQIKYDYIETANRISEALEKQQKSFRNQMFVHPIYDRIMIKAMVRDLIARRQMSLRRFVSVMRLVDEEFYESFMEVLKNKKQLPVQEVVTALREILLESEAETMVSNLKIIKRELASLKTQEFLSSLQLLIRKQKLPEDNRLGCILKLYNIVRDLRSQYVINGRYTYTVYQMAVKKYKQDIREYEMIGEKKEDD